MTVRRWAPLRDLRRTAFRLETPAVHDVEEDAEETARFQAG
ncbi:hypothetical protein PV392_24005 [Streptomyces sp. ME03-5709C]|nr:hypothetical protein [Streptomyces sp. ME03-5709C]